MTRAYICNLFVPFICLRCQGHITIIDDMWFIYRGQPKSEIPRDITHLRIDPSVKVIGRWAFWHCTQLVEVKLCEGLERIEEHAFRGCKSLKHMHMPSTVKEIDEKAFYECEHLVEVELCPGIEKIGFQAFDDDTSLEVAAQ